MCFFEGGDLKVQLSWKFERYEHRDDTSIVDGDQEGVKCYLSFVLKDQVKNSVYQHLSKDTSPTIYKELIKILQDYKNNKFISETEYTQLRPHGSISPAARFYGLPKIHKNMSMCPIVSACDTATYNTAKLISKILQNYCGKTSSFVKDSTDFIQKIKHLSINPEEETLVSLDVNNNHSGSLTAVPSVSMTVIQNCPCF